MTVIGVVRESPPERRVALVPEAVAGLSRAGMNIVVEAGAGAAAYLDDAAYAAAGATLASRGEVLHDAQVLVCVRPPDEPLHAGQVLLGLLEPYERPELARGWAERGVTALDLSGLPRTLSRAQAMDALTSQANVAGYKAAVLAADIFGGFFPMLTTAAGTSRPAAVLVLGTGVAGLQAIGTARRLGAVVTGYDLRPQARDEVASLGAHFLDLGLPTAEGAGGYARALSTEEQLAQQQALDEQVARFDVVITTARVPGRRPPLLVTENAVKAMRPGSVAVDLAAGWQGGNIEGSVPDAIVITDNGVTLIGAGNLPSAMAPAASRAYARNIAAVLNHLIRDGAPVVDPTDEITAGLLLTGGTS